MKGQFVLRFLLSILVILSLTNSSSRVSLYGQQFTDFSPLTDRNAFGPVVMDDSNAYCYWPSSLVTEPAVTAVELSTGRPLWSKPARLAVPFTFRVEDGWLQYETTDSDQVSLRRSSGPRTFHLVNSATGTEWIFPTQSELRSNVDRTWVHRGYCLTPHALIVSCSDGTPVGNLGPGEHQTVTNGEDLLATTLLPDKSNTRYEKRLLRRFNLSSMQVQREMELPLEVAWRIVAIKGDIIVGRVEAIDRDPQLVCLDLSDQSERWRVAIPKSVRAAPFKWEQENCLTMAVGAHGLIWPLDIDMTTGSFSPDMAWRDPRLLLAWHQEGGQYPDFIALNDNFIIGRWRYLQLACVDAHTGQLIWDHRTSNHLIGRAFSSEPELGKYMIAESRKGFDIITVANGDRLTIIPEQFGLVAKPPPSSIDEDEGMSTLLSNSALSDSSRDWLWDQGLLLGPLIPFVGWLFWSLIRR